MRTLVTVFVGLLAVSVAHGYSPAIMWPADEFQLRDGQSPLEVLPMEAFRDMFKNKKVIVFHKKSFSIEDVSYPTEPMPYLSSVEAVALQGVKGAQRLLASLTATESLKVIDLDGLSKGSLDKNIKEIMAANPGYAAILVGTGSQRSRREAKAGEVACSARDECMGYVASVKTGDAASSCSVKCEGNDSMSVTVDSVTIKVSSSEGGYGISVECKSDDCYKLAVDTTWAPQSFSYSCAELRLVPSKPKSALKDIVLTGFQVWPYKGQTFPESFDCATWFTTTLWMGVVVVLFYLFVLFGAILFLLDVKTNDRFDDPKGKTITVNVAE